MRDVAQDLRFGFRMLGKRPGTSTLAIVALALGIGLTTTMFSLVQGVFLRGLPFERADRLLYADAVNPKTGRPSEMHILDYVDIRAAQRSFEALAALSSTGGDVAAVNGIPMRYSGTRLTANALSVLRVRPMMGRDFTEADMTLGADKVALISHRIWSVQFMSTPDIVGRVIMVNNEPTMVIGVMPARFGFPASSDVWLPLSYTPPANRNDGLRVGAFGRLRDGVTMAQANRELAEIAARLEAQYPENKERSAQAIPLLRRFISPQIIGLLSTMLAAVFCVLLIACVNVTNLQLARAAERTKEVAVRLAIGASRGRIVRQLFCEGAIISAIGAALGLALAQTGIVLLNRAVAIDDTPPFWIEIKIDPTVLLFTAAITVLAAVASTFLPALRLTRGALATALNDDARGSTSLKVGRFSRGLVVVQMMLSFTLLLGSGLIVKSISAISTIVLPYRADVLAARLDLGGPAFPDNDSRRITLERIRARVAADAGVTAVTFGSNLPSMAAGSNAFRIDGVPLPLEEDRYPRAERIAVAPDYFNVMRMPILRGRALGAGDRIGSEPVAVVSGDFSAQYLGGGDPIGRRFHFDVKARSPIWFTIVGVAPPAVNATRSGRPVPSVFVPLDHWPVRNLDVLVATADDPLGHQTAVRRAVADVNATIAVHDVNTTQGRLDRQTWTVKVFGGLFTAFGGASLLLATAGLYGVMAFAVRRRTQEIGVRMALGATQRNILQLVLKQGSVLLVIGMTLGLGAGLLLAAQLKDLLYRVRPWDPLTVSATIAVLAAAGLLACLVPARRASSVDPLTALRRD